MKPWFLFQLKTILYNTPLQKMAICRDRPFKVILNIQGDPAFLLLLNEARSDYHND